MASSNGTKPPEQQSSNSSPTTPVTPATAERPRTEIADDRPQGEDEVAEVSDTENHHSKQAQGKSKLVAPSTAMDDTPSRAVEPQQQNPTETDEMSPERSTTPNDVVSHGEEDSDPGSERSWDFDYVDADSDDQRFASPRPRSPIGK